MALRRPYQGKSELNPFTDLFNYLLMNSAQLWAQHLGSQGTTFGSGSCNNDEDSEECIAQGGRGLLQRQSGHPTGGLPTIAAQLAAAPSVYYYAYHFPMLLHVPTLRKLWGRFPEELSASLDAAFRYANLTDIVGLHHAEVARQILRARRSEWSGRRYWGRRAHLPSRAVASCWSRGSVSSSAFRCASRGNLMGTVAGSRIVDIDYHLPDAEQLPMAQRLIKEVRFHTGEGEEWQTQMKAILATEEKPVFFSVQDSIRTDGEHLHSDCLRERFLSELLPTPSIFEDASRPPDRCAKIQSFCLRSWVPVSSCIVVSRFFARLVR